MPRRSPSRIGLTTPLIGRIIAAVTELKDAAPEPLDVWKIAARHHDALALFATMGGISCLRPDGELILLGIDDPWPAEPLDRKFWIEALVVGVERFPWLAELLPMRQPSDLECSQCRGHGNVAIGSVCGFICGHCSGLGWVTSDGTSATV